MSNPKEKDLAERLVSMARRGNGNILGALARANRIDVNLAAMDLAVSCAELMARLEMANTAFDLLSLVEDPNEKTHDIDRLSGSVRKCINRDMMITGADR